MTTPSGMPIPGPYRSRLVVLGALILVSVSMVAAPAHATADWQVHLNEARANAGLVPVSERADWSAAAEEHARYIVRNGLMSHEQDPSLSGASEDGAWAAEHSNLYAGLGDMRPDRAIHKWLNSPNHARWMLEPGLREVGFGDYEDRDAPLYTYAAVLPVLDGVDAAVATPARFTYPGDGSVLRTHPEEGAAAAVETLHLFREDLGAEHDGRIEALVTVDGRSRSVAGHAVADGHVAIELGMALPWDGEVNVVLLIDGVYDDHWTFETSSTSSAPPTPDQETTPPLWDIAGTTHEEAIRTIADAGLIDGFRDGSFGPERSVRRGQLATLVSEALGETAQGGEALNLTDVEGSVHELGIRAALSAGWMSGYPDGTFRPSKPVTRGQLASTLTAAFELPDASTTEVVLADVDGTTHEDGIRAVLAAELANGFFDGTFRPDDPVTRGQLSSILVRAMGLA